MTPDRIKELRALCDAATPGPWMKERPNGVGSADDMICFIDISSFNRDQDAAFIAAARPALPEALAEIEKLRLDLTDAVAEIGRQGRELGKIQAENDRLRSRDAAASAVIKIAHCLEPWHFSETDGEEVSLALWSALSHYDQTVNKSS